MLIKLLGQWFLTRRVQYNKLKISTYVFIFNDIQEDEVLIVFEVELSRLIFAGSLSNSHKYP